MKQKIIMARGLPASGKSTWSREMTKQGYKRVNRDDLRSMIDDSVWSKRNEVFIIGCRNAIISNAVASGYSIIVDDTNLSPSNETDLRQIAKTLNVDFEIKDFTDVSLDVCLERDRKRNPSVGKEVIMRMYNQFLKPEFKQIEYNPNLPDAIICDLDGSLCIKGDRDIYDESKIYLDTVNKPILEILKGLAPKTTIIFCSGRTDSCYAKTDEWLWQNVMDKVSCNFHLLMRKTGDKRGDEIIKKEIYNNEIKDKFNIKFVIDDRLKVVRMWRNLGLFVLEVNQSGEEF